MEHGAGQWIASWSCNFNGRRRCGYLGESELSTIPVNQRWLKHYATRLHAISTDPEIIWVANQIKKIADDLSRRKAATKAPVQSDPMSAAKKAQIRAIWRAHPDWSQQKIGFHANVISGRVSETIRGKRK
jgi:hypothetical protein